MNRRLNVPVFLSLALVLLATASSVVLAQQDPNQVVMEGDEDAVRLSLAETLSIGLENNLDLVTARFEPQSRAEDIRTQQAAFDPTFQVGVSHSESQSPIVQASSVSSSTIDTIAPRYEHDLKIGGRLEVDFYRLQQFEQDAPNVLSPTSFFSTVDITYSMPLLKGFGSTATTEQLVLARNNYDISLYDLENQAETTIETIEGAYWNVLAAREQVRISKLSLRRAEDLLELNRKKVDVGTLAPIEITQAEAGVASEIENVIVAEVTLEDSEDELLRLLAIPDSDSMWGRRILPTDRPSYDAREVDVEEAIATAMEHRSDLISSRESLTNNELSEKVAKRNVRHQLDLRANYGPQGASQDFIIGGIQTEDASLGSAVGNTFNGDNFGWSLGLQYRVPLNNRAAKATFSKAQLTRMRSEKSLDNTAQTVRVDVRKAARGVTSGIKRVDAARKNVDLQREKLDAEQKKFDNGMSTSFEVLTFQRDLADAELRLINAALDYTKSLAALERSKGTLLEARGLSIAEE